MSTEPLIDIRSILPKEMLFKGDDGKAKPGPITNLDGKYIGLYFSASWCPPCKAFTPKLKEAYEMLTRAGKPFEIIFVSSDSSTDEFKEYYDKMPWAALPFSSPSKAGLSTKFGVQGIPTLVMLSPDGQVVSPNARNAVMSNPNDFPWEGVAQSDTLSTLRKLLPYLLLGFWIIFRLIQWSQL